MKLRLKTIMNVQYELTVDNALITVECLKQEIEKKHHIHSTNLKLLYNGVVLSDYNTLRDYNINDNALIIMMINKLKPINTSNEVHVLEQQQQQQQQVYHNECKTLVEMGFNNDDALSAITNTKGDVQLAIDNIVNGYCCNDNSEHNSNDTVMMLQKAASIIKVLCVEEPSGLDTVLQNIQQHDPILMEMISENEDKFKEMLSVPLNEKDIQIFEEYQKDNDNEDDSNCYSQVSHSQCDESSSVYLQQIELTQEEVNAIGRLKELTGVNEDEIVQVYLACGKNEEVAASILMETRSVRSGCSHK
jgi:hypothetical protein